MANQHRRRRVRKPPLKPSEHLRRHDPVQHLAHTSNQLVAQLNESWRVVDDPLQWILQRRKGNPRSKAAGWRGRSYCGMREALVRCVREYCGEVDVDALAKLNKLPVWHLDWDRTNLDVPETDHAQSDRQSEPLAAKALEVPDADE
jgi:hypothetical protein